MANFSGAVRIADVNDFIAPSQACVVNLQGGKERLPDDLAMAVEDAGGQVQLNPRASASAAAGRGFQQVKTTDEGAVKVSLNDCLACSGCVTTAETVLLEQQSTQEFLERIAQPGVTTIVSISPQSRASLAEYYKIPPKEAFLKLTSFFKDLGASHVYDTSCSRDVSLMEGAADFLARYRQAAAEAAAPGGGKALPAASPSASPAAGGAGAGGARWEAGAALPLLASSCPGWVCYAEKTHGHVLPHISTAKSPMAVMGALVKRLVAPQLGLQPGKVLHCSVMPCYDKKLEASREDFHFDPSHGGIVCVAEGGVPEVDLVLTTGEVLELLQARGVELPSVPPAHAVDTAFSNADASGVLFSAEGGGAGGLIEHVYRRAARELFGQEVPPGPLDFRTLRNSDMRELSLEVGGVKVLNFAAAYGFRNIQTLMRKIKLKKCDYHFVEVMACPSACLNGGGQIKPGEGRTGKQLIEDLERVYHHTEVAVRAPEENEAVAGLYREWLGGGAGGERAREMLHTQYHKRDAVKAPSSMDW